ncbi:alpha-2-macroglobulin [Rubritalea halochordaticola]|uniref:Alpha-2-macroglobulin n=1 Tax=Rubritalea halochordaticola TaxID=714537 RepID=A0ABP9UX96_9BACT
MKRLAFTLSLLAAATLQAKPTLHISTSDIRPESTYKLVFDRAVVPESVVNTTTTNSILSIKPEIKGELRWSSQNMAQFIPSEAPKMGTEYTFSINSKLQHLDKSPIPDGKIRSLASEAFKPSYHRKSSVNNRMPSNYIRFNDDVDPDKIEKFFYYIDEDGHRLDAVVRQATWGDLESTYYIRPSWHQRFINLKAKKEDQQVEEKTEWQQNSPISNGVIVTPEKPLPIGEKWNLMVKKGLPNLSKTNKTPEQIAYFIWSIKPFEIKEISPLVRADHPREILFYFNSNLAKDLKEDQLSQLITVTPTPPNLKISLDGNSYLVASGDFSGTNNYTVTVSEDLAAANGLTLEKSTAKKIVFKNVESGIGLPTFNTAQLSKGHRTYTVDTVNMKEIHVRIKALEPKQLIRTEQGYRHYTGDGYNYDDISPTKPLPFELISGDTVYDQVIALDNKIDTSKRITLNWDEILPDKQQSASLFVSVVGTPKDQLSSEESRKREAQAVIQLTDLGLAWKIAEDHVWIYTYSLDTGLPVPSATVSIYGEDAKLLQTVKSDKSGLAKLPRSEADRHLIAHLKDDSFAVTFDNSLSTVYMWRFPVNFSWSEKTYWERDMMTFTDRNLYRPGEKVRFKAILREFMDNQIRLTEDSKVQVQLRDPDRKELFEKEITLSKNGSLDTEFDLPSEKVGTFSIHCQIVTNEAAETVADADEAENEQQARSVFLHRFSVQEFRRNAFEISANLPAPKPGDTNIQLDVEANYYQGTPVAEGELQWHFTSTPTGFYPDKFRDFKFGDHRKYDPYYWSYYFGYKDDSSNFRDSEHKNGKLTLSSDGSASVSMDIPKLEFPSPQRLSFTSSIRDTRDQTLSDTQTVVHHPTAIYYGISRRDQLTRVNEPFKLNIVAVDPDGEYSKTTSKVSVQIQREYHVTNKVKSDDGRVRVHNETKIEDISTQEFEVKAGKTNALSLTAEKPGRYIFTVKGADAEGRESISASHLYVYGSKEYPWATEEGMRIKLVSEKKNYLPGDTARILVMTPIEGTALVSVERKGVIQTFRRTLSMDKPVIEFPIDDTMAPNAYVSVLVIRGAADSPHKYKQAALKLGFCEISVTDPSKKLKIALEIPGDYHRPGEEVTVTGKVTDHRGRAVSSSEVVLYAEDEGTLAVMGYHTPSPLKHFHRDRPLSLRTGVSLGSIVSENPEDAYYGNKGFTIGGGGGFFGDTAGEDIKPRNNFDPCAAWFPTVITDSKGQFKLSFNTPDTLTRYRVMATALSGADRFGSTSTDLVVSKNIMLEPKPPRFASEGDTMTQRVLVQNASKLSGTWDVSLTADSLTKVIGATENTLTKSVTLTAGEQATVSFDVSFINTGETQWTWRAIPRELEGTELTSATRSEYSDAMINKFEVTYPRPLLRHANFIRFEDGNENRINLVANVNPILMNGRGHADLELSNSLLLEAGGAVDYLLRYPYGCVEQTTSSLMPWFAVRDLKSTVPGFANTSEKKVKEAIQKGANRLLSMQTSSGGLSYWPGEGEATDWATAYGGMALLLAKQQGANVPDSAIDGITKYLAESLRKPAKPNYNQWHADTECRALYVLALAGKPQQAFQNKFYDMKDKLGDSSRAFLALAIHHSGGAKDQAISLLTEPVKDDPNSYWMRYRANVPSQLLAWSTIDPKGEQADLKLQELLAKRGQQGHWHTTWVNGWALHAMAAYARYVESERSDSTITLHLASGTKTIQLSKNQPVQNLRLPLEEVQNLEASSDHKAFARVVISAKPEVAPVGPVGHSGLAIKRRYERVTSDGKTSPLLYPKVGDLVLVTLDITFADELQYVAIDDPLPSTFEIVNEDFASQAAFVKSKKNWKVARTELRDDRALFFLNRSWRGRTDSVSYLARITAEGEVHAPPAKVEAMYDPSKYALSGARTITTTR